MAREFFVEVPKYGEIPCANATQYTGISEILYRLSCAAIQSKLYIVVNLGEVEYCDFNTDSSCPSDDGYHYNTNVVFDRNGAIVSRYRKFHLYFEPQFNYPTLEYSTFNTDFGVEFGLFTCFDIIFAHPAVELVVNLGIHNFAFPTAWIDELPFLTAIQSQALWAQSNQVNLLASGYHQPDRGSMGSGIYSGDEGALNYVFDASSGTKLVTSLVPITSYHTTSYFKRFQQPTQSASQDPPLEPYHMWLREDLTNCSYKPIDPYLNHEFLCHENSFCCNIEYSLNSTSYSGHLKLLVFDGRRTVAAKRDWFEWQVCAILHCLNDTLESCTESSPESSNHPKFNFIKIQAQPLKVEYGDEETSAAQPGMSLLDTKFRLIPQSQFKILRWRDSTTGNMNAEAETTSTSEISHFQVKTVALIQKVYGGRL
ncbi:unnamed protein product [Orchesella dallaii]